MSLCMMNSEEQVQAEGVDCLVKVSKEYLSFDDAQFLVFNTVQMIMSKSDASEGAKIASLLILEKFAEENIFTEN